MTTICFIAYYVTVTGDLIAYYATKPDVSLPIMPDNFIATPVPLVDPPQQDVSPDLPHQDASPNLPQHHPLPQRVRRSKPMYFGPSFVNTITCYPLPPTLEPKTITQALKDPLWRQAMDDEFNTLLCNHT
ncbi:hypothetical protein V6N12_069206 [Hibiscus sabdariffa]|uniref:Mitochondrial protein n=1 Tax=Hibiscus sabdariffa TaxID=183260 RepID=A0ABR2FD55_9ROSI